MKKAITSAVLCFTLSMGSWGAASAQETIDLTVGSFLPESHHVVRHGTKVLVDDLVAQTNGQVNVTLYPAEQAGKAKQLLELMQAGALDIVEVALGYYAERFPLFGVMEMPGLTTNACAGVRALRTVADPGGLIYESDIAPQGLRSLAYIVFPPYSAITTQPIRSPADFQGKKLRIAGGAMELEVTKLGGVPVKISSPETYQSLARGTIDGALLTYLSAKQYDLQEVAKYATKNYSFGGAIVILMITEKKFQSLPDDVQTALIQAGHAAEQAYCSFAQDGQAAVMESLEEAGVEFYEFTPDQTADLDTTLASLSQDWAQDLDSRGKPASEVLARFTAALADQN